MHATVGVQTLQSLPIPLIPEVGKEFLKEQQQLQRDIFCKVYSALLDDVEALDKLLESKFSKEIIRIVSTIAASFRIDDELFIERLGLLGRKAKQPVAVDGLSGATVLDYLVNLMAEKSQYRGFQTLGGYQNRLSNLRLSKAIREVSKMDKPREEQSSGEMEKLYGEVKLPQEVEEVEDSPGNDELVKSLLRGIGLPKVLFICIGPHTHGQDKEDKRNHNHTKSEKQTDHNENHANGKKNTQTEHQEDHANGKEKKRKKEHEEKTERNVHVVASSAEAFADNGRKRWAQRMQYERMHSVSIQNFQEVCATERRFFTASESKTPRDSILVMRHNNILQWLADHAHPLVRSPAAASTSMGCSGGPVPEVDPRIGGFQHGSETAGAFNTYTGFERRARCYKCASLYLYWQDLATVGAESDMKGPHRSEPLYNWLPRVGHGQGDGTNEEGESELKGPSCAEPLCHLMCSELM